VGKVLSAEKKQKPKAFSRRDVQTIAEEPKPEPETQAPTVEFKVEELTKSQVERDLPFVGPKPTGDLRAPETLETPIARDPSFGELTTRIGALTPQSTEEEIKQAEADLELFGRTPNIGGD